MRVLFLDDDESRHIRFRRLHVASGHLVTFAYTAAAAVDALSRESFDRVYLDHDLGGPESEGLLLENAPDGRSVARAVAEDPERHRDCMFVVHSLNAAGAATMVATLRAAGLEAVAVPFGWKLNPDEIIEVALEP